MNMQAPKHVNLKGLNDLASSELAHKHGLDCNVKALGLNDLALSLLPQRLQLLFQGLQTSLLILNLQHTLLLVPFIQHRSVRPGGAPRVTVTVLQARR